MRKKHKKRKSKDVDIYIDQDDNVVNNYRLGV